MAAESGGSATTSVAIFAAMANTSAPAGPKAVGPSVSTRMTSLSDTRRVTGGPGSPTKLPLASYACAAGVTPPKSGRPPMVRLARLSSPSRSDETSVAIAWAPSPLIPPLLDPCTVRSRIRCAVSSIDLQGRVRLVQPALRVVDVPAVLRRRGLVEPGLHRPVRAGRRVRRLGDELAGGELLLELAHEVEVPVEALQAGERDGALGDPHRRQRPTRPVRLIRVSSVSSIAVTSRPAAE